MDMTELFRGLDDAEAQDIRSLAVRVELEPGQRLFRLGDEADRLFVVERGRIALTLPLKVREREEDVLVEERLPGQAFGWSALIPPHHFTLTAGAPVDSAVLALPRAALHAHFAARPSVGYLVTRNLAAIVGHRLQVVQAMWLREVQRVVAQRCA